MKEKIVLVTGSNRGLGAACIKEFAKNGYNVIINYYENKDEAEKLKEEVEKKYSIKALVIQADVSKEDEVASMIEESIREFKRIDVLVNNAGIAIDKPFVDKTVEDFKRTLEVNLISVFLTSKYISPYMLENKYGKIINISSTNGIDTLYPESMDYDASKAGIISLTHNLATEFAPVINVNAVAPGWINTDMNKDLPKEFKEEEAAKVLLKRFAEPEEIAKVVYFLASEDARYINNSVIRVDGGI